MQYQLPGHVEYVLQRLLSRGFEVAVVGGAVRDVMLGRTPKDFDVVCSAPHDELLNLFDKTLTLGEKHGTTVVMIDRHRVEVSICRGCPCDGADWEARLREDLLRRDFTINAMAINHNGELYDPWGGRSDLLAKLIKAPCGQAEERFREDPLRMLRAVRLATVLDFNLAPGLVLIMEKCLPLLERVAIERIREEFVAILLSKHPAQGLRMMVSTGLMQQMMPELMAMVGFEQHNPAHINDVFNHSLAVVENVPAQLEIRLAALLHDIGKPTTFTMDSEGVGHFYHHQEESQRQTLLFLNRFKFSRAVTDRVSTLVGNHMFWLTRPDREAVSRLLIQVGKENLPDLFTLQKADINGSASFHDSSFIDQAESILKEIIDRREPMSIKDLQVNGNDLIEIGYREDARLGRALQYLLDMVLKDPEQNQKELLLATASKLLPNL